MESVREKRLQSGELYAIVDGGRYKLANCKPTIEVYESEQKLKLKGKTTEYTVKSYRAALVICEELTLTRNVDIAHLEQISDFDIKLDLPRKDGTVLERVFQSIVPETINLNGSWVFDMTGYIEEIKVLFPDLIFG